MTTAGTPVLSVTGLGVDYASHSGLTNAVKDVKFVLRSGRICGLAGESGSGKSSAALAAIGWNTDLQRRIAGTSELDGIDLFSLEPKALRRVWGGRIGYVPQEIGGSLHPTYRIEAARRAVELLSAARIPDPTASLARFPHQFSGGQLQRIALALALALEPEVLVLDEPTTDLDVTTQHSVTSVLRTLVEREGVAALFITHDLALLAEIADDLVVMYAGQVVEAGPIREIVAAPRHPYTRALLDAVPSPERAVTPRGIPGMPPGRVVEGRCAFVERCRYADERGRSAVPPLTEIDGHRLVRCWRGEELALTREVAPARVQRDGHQSSILEIRDLVVAYGRGHDRQVAVEGASLTVPEGGVAALVGESGSGKSTLARAIAGVVAAERGEIVLAGKVLPRAPGQRTRDDRRAIQIIFQNPASSLNPRRTIGDLLRHIATRFIDGPPAARWAAVREVLDDVQLPEELMGRYPSQLSGGQRQRVAIASAFIARPKLVICDEITSGQDVSVQAAVLRTLSDLRERYGCAVLFVSHDLGVVRSVADRVYVMQRSKIVERGSAEAIFDTPRHPYTRELLSSVPSIEAALR